MKKTLALGFCALLGIFFFATTSSHASDGAVATSVQSLPYPGILVDHPLYFIKETRDLAWLILTRDQDMKSDLLKHIADKKMSMALLLSDKGKWNLSVDVAQDSQEDLYKATHYAQEALKDETIVKEDLVDELKISCDLHQKALEDLQKTVPQGEKERIDVFLAKNEEIRKMIGELGK
ncbi:MAG: DUF5667 domain-containing protein [Candidatus Roizmanbacteria bacterium]